MHRGRVNDFHLQRGRIFPESKADPSPANHGRFLSSRDGLTQFVTQGLKNPLIPTDWKSHKWIGSRHFNGAFQSKHAKHLNQKTNHKLQKKTEKTWAVLPANTDGLRKPSVVHFRTLCHEPFEFVATNYGGNRVTATQTGDTPPPCLWFF